MRSALPGGTRSAREAVFFTIVPASSASEATDRTAELAHKNCDVVRTAFLGDLGHILLFHADSVVAHGQFDLVAGLFHARRGSRPFPAGNACLMAFVASSLTSRPVGTASIRIWRDPARFGLHLDRDAGIFSDQARGNGLGDFRKIRVHRNGPSAAGMRDQIVKFRDRSDAGLHRRIALNPGLGRRSGFEARSGRRSPASCS